MSSLPYLRFFLPLLGVLPFLAWDGLRADTCAAPPVGLVAWWPGENNGADVRQATPATADNSGYIVGKVGQAFRLNTAGSGLGLGAAPRLQREDFTVEAWVQRRAAQLVSNDGGARGWFLAFGAGGWGFGITTDGRLALARVGEAEVSTPAPAVVDTALHHVAVTRVEGTVTFFVDGLPIGTTNLDQRFRFTTAAAIGRRGDDKSGSFAGTIDELAVFDRALDPAEIATLNTAGSAGKCPPAADVPDDVALATERWIHGSTAAGQLIVVSDGFSVYGRLRLESSDAAYTSGVDVGTGDLVNEVGGEIAVNAGTGGLRLIRGNLLNRGVVNVGSDLTLDRAGAQIRNEGILNLNGAGLFLRGGGVQLELAGGTVTGSGRIDGDGAHVRFLGGHLEVATELVNSTLEIGPGNTNSAGFALTGSNSRLRGDIAAAQSVLINGSGRGGQTVLHAPLGFANAGTLRLASRDAGYTTTLVVDSGTLTNLAGGLLVSGPGAGGSRQLAAELRNEGTFQIDHPLLFGATGAVHVNRGTVNVSAGSGLTLGNGGQTFRQEAGLLQLDGPFDVTGVRFEYLGGRINGAMELVGTSLLLGPDALEPVTLLLTRGDSTFEGDIKTGQTVWIRGDGRGSHTVLTRTGFANRGTLLIQSADAGYTTGLTLSAGSLTNDIGGQVTVGAGAGGPRPLSLELLNLGDFKVAQSAVLGAVSATHVNRGTLDINPGTTLYISGQGQTFRQEAGTLNLAGGLDLTAVDFEYLGGHLNGTPYLDGVNLVLGPAVTEPFFLTVSRSTTRLHGTLKPGQQLWIRGDGRGGHTTAVAPDGLLNHGTLRLESADAGYVSSLSVPTGILENAADGILAVNAGAGGPRTLSATLLNEGLLSVKWPLTVVAPGATHVNRGELDIAAGMTLFLSGQGQTFRQEAGRLSIQGGMDVSGMRLEYVGGVIEGTPYLDGVDLVLGPAVTEPFFLQLGRSSSVLHGDLKPGQTLWIRGDGRVGHMILSAPDGLANSGHLILESRDAGYTSGFSDLDGSATGLLNQPGGVISVNVGAGGPRPLNARLLNRGRIEMNQSVSLGRNGLTHRNEGEWLIAPGAGLDLPGSGQVFEQAAGLLQVDGAFSVRGQGLRYLGGLINGTVYMVNAGLEFGAGAGPSGTFLTGGSGMRYKGTVPHGATVVIQGSGEVAHSIGVATNGLRVDGTLILVSRDAGYTSSLRVDDGSLAIGPGGRVQVSQGASGPRAIDAAVVNAGELRVDWPGTVGRVGGPVLSSGRVLIAPGATLTVAGGLQATAGRIEGAGTLSGAVTSDATIAPGPGMAVFTIDGPLQQGSRGIMEMEIGGTGPGIGHDQLHLTGVGKVGGLIRVSLVNGYIPAEGASFPLITGPADLTGARLELPALPAGREWRAHLTGGLMLSVVAAQPAAGQFAGRVVDRDGHPVAGLTVLATRPSYEGLFTEIFKGTALAGPAAVRRWDLSIDNDWGSGGPDPTVGIDQFSIRWTGLVVPAFTEHYLFHTYSDDGVRLWINDQLLVDDWGDHGTREDVGAIDLVAGQQYALRMEYYENGGGAVARLYWSGASRALEVVPPGRLLPPADTTGLPPAGKMVVTSVTDSDGHYTVPVAGGEWTVDIGGLDALGFDPVTPVTRTIAGVQTVDFILRPLSSPRYADLIADAPAFPSPGVGGQPLAVTWKSHNQGDTRAVAPWVETVLFSSQPSGVGAQELGRLTVTDGLVAGVGADRQLTVVPPVGLSGHYYIFVRVDTTLQVDEGAAEENNVSPGTPLDLLVGDLVVDRIEAPVAMAYGDSATVRWVVRNAGGVALPAPWWDTLSFGANPGGGALLATVAAPVAGFLAAGASYTNSADITIPIGAQNPPGTFYFTVLTDAAGERVEASESNNLRASAPVILSRPPPADLAVTAVTAPATAPAGQPVPFVWTVQNLGLTRAVAPWVETVTLTTPAGANPVLLARWLIPDSLEPGASITRTQQFILPAILAGERRVTVTTDADDQVFESGDPANNTLTAAGILTLTAPDLVVESVSTTAGTFGTPLSFHWVVRNRGNGPAVGAWSDRLTLTGPSGTLALPAVARPGTAPLAPGASYAQVASPVAPVTADSHPGKHRLTVVADGAGDVEESDESNNSGQSTEFQINLPPLPDLVVLSVHAPVVVPAGEPVELIYVVTNRGAAPASALWSDFLNVATAADPSIRRRLATVAVTDPIAAGGAVTRTNRVTLPLEMAGDVLFSVDTDGQDQVFESDEANNRGVTETPSRVPLGLSLAVDSDQVAEDVIPAVLHARITRSGPIDSALTVVLTSSDVGELRPPVGLIIPAGRSVVDADLAVVHDGVVDGPKTVSLTVAADGFASGQATVTVLDADRVALTLELSAPSITEGLTLPVTLRRTGAVTVPLVVVVSAGTGDLLPPATVLIGAGQSAVTFALIAADNDRLDGSRASSLAVSAAGVIGDVVTVTVNDNDDPGLVVEVEPGSISEADGGLAATGTVRRTRVTGKQLKVALASSDPNAAYVPPTVVIPANGAAVSFPVTAINDNVVNGTRILSITAQVLDSVTGLLLAQATPARLEVRDDDGPALHLSLGASLAREGRSPAFTAVVSRNTDTGTDLTVSLAISDAAEAAVPATVVIKAGDRGAAFPVRTLDDGVVDGNKRVTLNATAAGFTPASSAFTVTDAQLPDLVVAEVRAAGSGATGDLASFGYKIRNQGFAAFTGTIVQRVWLSSDPVLDAGDLLLDETPFTGTMLPGDAFDRDVSRRLPLQAGTYYVLVVTDVLDAVHETLEDNNVNVAAGSVTVAPAYAAVVETAVTVAPAGTPVPMKGEAHRTDGRPAVSELVNIHIRVAGTERIVSALTDGDGRFTFVFNPVPGEYGKYEIGASHPGVPDAATQDQFELLGLRANPVNQFALVVPGKTNRLTVDLLNVNGRPLTALTAEVQANGGLAVTVQAPAELAAGATGTAVINLSSLVERDATGLFTVRFRSAEGAVVDVGVRYNVELPEPRLVVNPARVEVGVVRGRQTVLELDVANTGGADSGPIGVTLPDLPWFRPASPPPYASLAPGESRRITFLLTPDATVPLQIFEGRFALGNDLARVAVPFTFRHVSEALGDVRVLAEDELTYYGTNSLRVANAAVTLSDVYTGSVVRSGMTGPDGSLLLSDVHEGTYNLEVSAPKHDSYTKTVAIAPGKVNEFTGFLRTQLVRYSWKVEEIDVEERATIRLETIFETTVPVPVVTIEPSTIDLTHAEGEEYQAELKITNQGLIAAQTVKLNIGDGSTWSVRTLSDDLGIIPAKSTLTVPVVFTRVHADAASNAHRTTRPAGAGLAGLGVGQCQPPSIGVQWELICGRFGVAYYSPVAVIDLGLCPPLTGVTFSGNPLSFLNPFVPFVPVGGGGGGGSGGGTGEGIGVGTRGFVSYAGTNDCSCVKQGFQEKCVSAEGGLKGEAQGAVLGVINTLLPTYAKVLAFEVKLSGAAKMCTCCVEVGGQTVTGLKLEGEAGGEIEGKVLLGLSAETEIDVTVPGYSEAKAEVKGQVGLELALNGSVKVKASTDCLLTNPKLCVEARFTAKGFLGGKGSAEISATPPGGKLQKIGSAEIAIGFESGLSASVEGCTATGFSGKACLDAVVFKAEGEIGVAVGEQTAFVKIGSSTEIFPAVCNPAAAAATVLIAYDPYAGIPEAEAVARLLDAASPADLARQVTGREVTVSANASGRQLSDELIRKLGGSQPRTTGVEPTVVFENVLRSDRAAAQEKAQSASNRRSARVASGDAGICAQVRLLIEQQAVVTRKAIGATLEVVNESTDTPLEDLGVTIQIHDRSGNLANDRFVILDPELTRFQPMDVAPTNTYELGGLALHLNPDTTGSARWVILPTDDAAPVEPQDYYVGGFMTYRVGGVVKTAEFTPGTVRVYPNAKLALKYFHQRDVFSDDPFTPEIEPSIPFVLGVMVLNEGNGLARNVSITSAQPKIVENAKGLLIDFDIIATEVAGKPLSPSLRADFGDIAPGGIGIGRWLLKSSLQGLFLDYQATLVHDDRFGERGASVFAGVEIHEMIHQVEADRTFADGLPDFLVNDVADPDDLPDTLYLSDGRILPVAAVRSATNDGPPTADDLTVVLTAPMPSGWAYLRVPDPGAGKFQLRHVLRPDNSEVALGTNVWVTDRTFIGLGRRPIREFNLHLLDHDSVGTYRLLYGRDESAPDTTAPVSRVAALPVSTPTLIPVQWSGEDDASGAGIATFDIYVSVENGPFTKWLAGTRNNSAYYQGSAGRRYAFYSVARDAAGNVETAPGTPDAFTVATGNSPPTLETVPDVSIDEGGRVDLTLRGSDQDLPGDTLTYRLVRGPAGVVVDASTGRLTWQTGEADGPASVDLTVSVTDDGTPNLSAQQVFRVQVREVNVAPRLVLPARRFTLAEGSLLRFTATADDPDLPVNPFRYRLLGVVPAGATMQPSTGEFHWQPSEVQGGSDYTFTVEVNDQGNPPYTSTDTVQVTVLKVNSAPLVSPVRNRVVYEGDLVEIAIEAVDPDLPVQTLAYALAAGANGAQVDAVSGRFTWTPDEVQSLPPGISDFRVVVSDNGEPAASGEAAFRITAQPLKPGLNLPRRALGGDVSFRFKGRASGRYVLEGTVDLRTWQPLQEFVADRAIFTLIDSSSAAYPWRYFRAREKP